MPPIKKKHQAAVVATAAAAAAAAASASSMSARAVGVSHDILTGVFSIGGASPLSCVLAEYLDMKDIGRLDTAVCNNFLRPLYLDAMRHLTRSAIVVDSIEFTVWILLRGIKTKELKFYYLLGEKKLNNILVMMNQASYGFRESILELTVIEEGDYAIFNPFLLKCKNLEHLYFNANKMSLNYFKTVLPVFKKLKNLGMLNLNVDTENFDSSCVKFLSNNCAALQNLGLQNSRPDLLDDSALLSITNGLSSLTSLGLCNHDNERSYVFSEAALTSLKGLKMLKHLYLESIDNLTTPLLMEICHGCDKIVKLCLMNMSGLSNLSFESLGRLVHLYLENVPSIDATIQSIATHCSKLETLTLIKLTEITDIAIDYLANGVCQSLKMLDLTGCTRIKTLPQRVNNGSIKTVKKFVVEG